MAEREYMEARVAACTGLSAGAIHDRSSRSQMEDCVDRLTELLALGAALLELIPAESADRDLQSVRGWLQEDLKSQHSMLASLNAQGFHGKSTLTHQIPQPCRQPHHLRARCCP